MILLQKKFRARGEKNDVGPPVLFRESPCLEKNYFTSQLLGTIYEPANLDIYHELILNWSDTNQAKKHDWIAFTKNWILKDFNARKLITANNQSYGTTSNNSSASTGQSYSELGTAIDDYFERKYNS
jgi:hypothetical protein